MKKSIILLFLVPLISSCGAKIQLSPELQEYFDAVDYDKAYDNVKNATKITTSVHKKAITTYDDEHPNGIVSITDEVLGSSKVVHKIDKATKGDEYIYYDAEFEGTLVTSGIDENNRPIEKVYSEQYLFYLDEDYDHSHGSSNRYFSPHLVNGNNVSFNGYAFQDRVTSYVNSFFYASVTGEMKVGGMWYADTMYSIRKFSEYMSLDENNSLIYEIHNSLQVDPNDSQVYTGAVTEKIVVDNTGMLIDHTSTAYIFDPIEGENRYTVTSAVETTLTVVYNDENFVRTYDI